MVPGQFIKLCTVTGFDLPHTETADDIETIALVALLYDFNYHKGKGVLIGYDFSCDKGNKVCTGDWYSLDGTNKLNAAARSFNQKIGKEFVPIVGNAALILQDGMVKTVAFSNSYINSIPCQTRDEKYFNEISCSVSFADLSQIDTQAVMCKMDCKDSS